MSKPYSEQTFFHSSSSLCSYSPSNSITWTKAFDLAQGLSHTQEKAWHELLPGVGSRHTTACSMNGQSPLTQYAHPMVRISYISSGVLPEMVWKLQAARHVGFMGHLSLDHPMTEWLHHTVIEVSSIHWWECVELSQGIHQALPCCLSQVFRVLCMACFRCLTSEIQNNMPAL